MAIRSRYLGPDEIKRCVGGVEIPVVSRQAIVDAAIEAIVATDLTGGIITIALGRRETGFPNEKVTSEVVVTWQDRGPAKAQPEDMLVLAGEASGEVDEVEQAAVDESGAEEQGGEDEAAQGGSDEQPGA